MLTSTTVHCVPGVPPPPARGHPRGSHDPRSVLTRGSSLPDLVLRWADHADGVADVYLPPHGAAAAPAPALYALHGGFWGPGHDRRHLRPLARALCNEGWVVVVPEYARAGGRHVAAGLEAPWPLLADDLRTVRRLVPRLLAEVVPGGVNGERPVLVGHSAGGQLALWWALDVAGAPEGAALPPRQVLALAPVADLARARAEQLGDGAVEALLGSEPAPPVAAAADPAARLRAGEWPQGCTVSVLHGADDLAVPLAHSTDLGADVPAIDVRALPGVEHFALIDPLSTAWPDVLGALPPPTRPTPPPSTRPT